MGTHVRILAGGIGDAVGSQVYNKELAQRLAARGYEVSVVCFSPPTAMRDAAKVYEIRCADYTNRDFFWRFAAPFQYRHVAKEFCRLNIPPADIVIGAEHLLVKAYKERFPQTPMIYVPHAPVAPLEIQRYGMPPFMCWATKSLYSYLQQWALTHADRTLRFTNVACQMLTDYYGSSISPRFVVNPVGFDLPAVLNAKTLNTEPRLLSVGRLVSWKRIDLALSALAKLQKYRWRLDIVGEGEARSTLEQQTRQLGLENRIRFQGFVPDLTPSYEQADLFLFPSECEGLGFVMLEAMSHRVPCLAIKGNSKNYWNASAEVIDHGRTGLLAADEADFSRQLELILRNPKQLLALGLAARERVKEHYAWDKHLDCYQELFKELMSTGQRACDAGQRRSTKPVKNAVGRVSLRTETPTLSYHHLLGSRELGGAGLNAVRLAKALTIAGRDSHVWCPSGGPAQQMVQSYGLTYHECDSARLLGYRRLHMVKVNYNLGHILRRYGVGIFHVHWVFGYGALQLGLRLSGLTRIVHVQLEEDAAGLRWVFKHPPEMIITCAQYLVDYVRQFLPEPYQESQRIVAVPNAVDTEKFFPGNKAEAKRRLGAAPGTPLILVTANLAPHKGQQTAIRAVAELKNRGVHVACWFLGVEREGTETYTGHLKTLVTELRVNDRIRFLGYRSDTPELLRAADFFLLPSTQEGLPLSILEAQATKVPVLTAPTAGIPEVVANGQTGFLIKADDYVAYAQSIEMLNENQNLYHRIAEDAHKQVRCDYNWNSYCQRISNIYDELLHERESQKRGSLLH